MMMAPRISSGLRPHLSTVTVAMRVNTTITMPMMTVLRERCVALEAHVRRTSAGRSTAPR